MNERRIDLVYAAALGDTDEDKQRIDNVSAATFDDKHLWTATDEGITFERLTRNADGTRFEDARSYRLSDFFPGYPPRRVDNPAKPEKEADLEGLCYSEGQTAEGKPERRLWMTASHALNRKKPETAAVAELIGQITNGNPAGSILRRQNARTLLGYVRIDESGDPVPGSGRMLPLGDGAGTLVGTLNSEWGLLARATGIAAKENGLDIEGIAVSGMKVLLGLRGPVVGPLSMVIELDLRETGTGLEIVRPDGSPACRPHLIDTGGLGIRDLALHASGLAVLTGPTMDSDGVFQVRLVDHPFPPWNGTATARQSRPLATLGTSDGNRRPEGLALVAGRVLVVAERKGKDNNPQILTADEHLIPPLT
ncbi:MAG: DUF3616 domain-containing protein [Hyphomicrobiaceae bacterium]